MDVLERESYAVRIKGGFPDPIYITPFDTKEEAEAYISMLDWEIGRSYAVVRVIETVGQEANENSELPGRQIVEV